MDLIREQVRRNEAADLAWALYAPHRERVTRLLLDARTPTAERLCLLGAGNLNDVNLTAMSSAFREIVLVDVDVEALRRGLERQGFADDGRFQIVAPVDVSGVFADLSKLPSESIARETAIDGLLHGLTQTPALALRLNERFDVVASVGLLTQLIDGVLRSVAESHPKSWDLVAAIRTQHLRLMLELTGLGGAAVLVTEVLSSDTCSELLSVPVAGLPGVLRREIAAKNFFTGTNPAALQHLLRTDVGLTEQLASVQFSEPWLWQFLARTYAVYGVTLCKRG